MRERWTVGHRVRTVTDDGMSTVEDWRPAVDVKVFSLSPPNPDDVIRAEQTGVKHELDVLSRTAFAHHRDKLVFNGVEWFVQGEPDDYTHGPFKFAPGFRTRLARVEG